METLSDAQSYLALQLHFSALPAALAHCLWQKAEEKAWTGLEQIGQDDWLEALARYYSLCAGQNPQAPEPETAPSEQVVPQISWERWQHSLAKAKKLAARSRPTLGHSFAANSLLLYGSPDYPPALYRLYRPPFLLFARGNRQLFAQAQTQPFAVCGSRKASLQGLSDAFTLAYGVCSQSLYFLISGLSEGIELAACAGALQAGRQSIAAVLCCGLEAIAPQESRRAAGRILESDGLLLSEYPPAQPRQHYTFLQRNRILCALASSLIMAELGERTKALNLVDYAVELNQDVAVLGNSPGVQRLREQGCSHWPDAPALLRALGMDCELQGGVHQLEYIDTQVATVLAENMRSELLQQSTQYLGRKIVLSHK